MLFRALVTGLFLLVLQYGTSQTVELKDLDVRFHVDTTSSLTAEEILRLPLQSVRLCELVLSNEHPTWVQLALPDSVSPGDYCLSTDVDEVTELFIVGQNETFKTRNGRFLPPRSRSVPEHGAYLCFPKTKQDTTILLKIDPAIGRSSVLTLEWQSQQETEEALQHNIRLTYLLVGAMLVILLCALTLFFFLKDMSHLWFCFYVVSAFLMSNNEFLGSTLGDRLPWLFLNGDLSQIFYIMCPLSLVWLCMVFFRIRTRPSPWRHVFTFVMFFGVLCFVTLWYVPSANADFILALNLMSVIVVGIYSAQRYFKDKYPPAGIFLLALIVPLVAACFIVLNYLKIFTLHDINLLAGSALLIQSIVLFIGVALRYQRTTADLVKMSLTKWQKEHEAKLFQIENAELISRNEIIEKQRMQLTAQARTLEEMNGTKDKLLSVLSHDLRTPVNNLRAILEMLSDRQMSPDEFHDLSAQLKTDVEGVHEMLEDVLHWVKSQSGGIVPRPVRFDIIKLVEEVSEILRQSAEIKHIHLQIIGEENINVMSDPDQTHIILRNFLSNAIKFATPNSTITIKVARENVVARISITDQGIGMQPEAVERIMVGNKVASTRGTKGEKGTGLGLLLCREFIQLNGGEFVLSSEWQKGTTVTFTLPVG